MKYLSRCTGKASKKKPSKSRFYKYLCFGLLAVFTCAAFTAKCQRPTATITFTSNNANPGYATTGNTVSVSLISTSGNLQSIRGTIGSHFLYLPSIEDSQVDWGGTVTLDASTPQGPIGYDFILTDEAGNTNELVSNSSTPGLVIFDNINPVFSTSQPSVTGANSSSTLTYTATWTDTNLDPSTASYAKSDVQVNATGTVAVGNVGLNNLASGVSTITLSNITGDGTVSIALPSKTAKDYAGNSTTAGFTSNTLVVDNTPPTATISAPSVDSVGNDGTASVNYTVTYADANFNTSSLTASGITLNTTGNATGTVNVTGSGLVYTVTISNITGLGYMGISLAGGYATDIAGNTDPGAGPSATFIVGSATATVGRTGLIVTNQTTLNYMVTFSAPVTGLTASNFNVTSSFPNAAITNITPVPGSSNTQYGIEISSDSSPIDGIDSLTLVNDAGLSVRLSGLPAGGAAYRILLSPFTVNATGVADQNGDTTGYIKAGTQVRVFLSSNRPVSNINGSIAGASASANFSTNELDNIQARATLSDPDQANDPVTYSLELQDQFGNTVTLNGGSGLIYDSEAPTQTVSYLTPISQTITSGGEVFYSVRFFDENLDVANCSLTPADILIHTIGSVSVGKVSVNEAGNDSEDASYIVELDQVQGFGAVSISTVGTAIDFAGNVADISLFLPSIDVKFTPPQCGISAPSAASVSDNGAASVSYRVSYSSATFASSNLTTAGITLNTTGTATGTVGVTGSGTSYTVTITNITGTGTLGISVAGGYALDTKGNNDFGAGPSATFSVLSNNAALANLTTGSGSLSPAFSSGNTSYTVSVSNTTSAMTVTPVAADATATITVNGASVSSGTASMPFALSIGPNIIAIVVTAQDGVTTQIYNLIVTRAAAANANLATLGQSVGGLTPSFATATTSYTDNVSNATASITLKPVSSDPTATITVNGTVVASGVVTNPVSLAVGSNSIIIVVTAQNGTTTKTYTLNVVRAASSIATLSSIKLSNGALSPVFASGTTTYTAGVINSVASVSVTPATSDANATITVNGTSVTPGTASGPIAIAEGTSVKINIAVTAQNGTTKQAYTVTVSRAPSSNAGLSTLGQSAGGLTPGLTPGFASATTSYNINVPNGRTTMTLKPVANDANASITVNGTVVASGTTTNPISLSVGSNSVSIVVTAQDGVTTKTYALTVTRAAAINSTLLTNLQLSAGSLSPTFVNSTLTYTAAEPNSVAAITVTPFTTDANETVAINGAAVASGTASNPVTLAVGPNTVTVIATSADGTKNKTYTITVTRAPSSDATLSSIKLSSGALSPSFASGTTSYTASVANTVSTITITAATTDANATIKVNGTAVTSGTASGAIALAEGIQTVINAVITAQDGTTTQSYNVTVARAPSTNANLSTLGQSAGGLSPAFSSTTTGYTENVSNATATMTLKPVSSDANATIKVNGTAVTSGTTTAPITLAVGANTITTVVTAQNGTTTKIYTLTVTRASGGADSFNPGISVTKPSETPDLADDGIQVHQGISPNGDGINDFLQIDNISQYPNNKLSIMNRNGQLIFEAKGYDNSAKVFDGHSNKNGQMQLPGTYFYQLDYTVSGITRHKTGFIILKY